MTQEEIKYHNRLWYYKTYNQLIDKCLQMEKDGYPEDMYTEVHHILPKCQGGTNDKNNLVRMPVRYHIIAHMLLASAFPDEKGLVVAVIAMFIGNKGEKENRNKNTRNSSRLISKFRELYKQSLKESGIITSNGKVIFKSKEIVCFDKNLKVIRLYSQLSYVSKDKFNPGSVGKACKSLGKKEYANYFWMYREDFEKLYPNELNIFLNLEKLPELDTSYGNKSLTEKLKSRKQKPRSKEWREKISISNKNKSKLSSSFLNHKGSERKVIGPNKIYNSIKEASLDVGVTEKTLRKWIMKYPERGFKYETERYIIGPDNTIYKSLGDCSKSIGYSKQTISKWIKNHPEKGFRFYTEKDNN